MERHLVLHSLNDLLDFFPLQSQLYKRYNPNGAWLLLFRNILACGRFSISKTCSCWGPCMCVAFLGTDSVWYALTGASYLTTARCPASWISECSSKRDVRCFHEVFYFKHLSLSTLIKINTEFIFTREGITLSVSLKIFFKIVCF